MEQDLRPHGYFRAMAMAPPLELANVAANVGTISDCYRLARQEQASVLLLPELCLTGFTCEDLFHGDALLSACVEAIAELARLTAGAGTALIVGAPYATADGRLFNVAWVLADGQVAGAVPKLHLPNYDEYYDWRWFTSGLGVDQEIHDTRLGSFRLSSAQLFQCGDARIALEVCEDLWAPDPPGVQHALAGADLILNPSASSELVAKADYRRDLVRMTSGQRLCGYLYASAGPWESSRDLVFGGHLLAAENGAVLAENERFSLAGSQLLVEFDLQVIRHDRRRNTTFRNAPRPQPYPLVAAGAGEPLQQLHRPLVRHPFVPADETAFDARARDILRIQSTGLARRVRSIGAPRLVIGLSGGLDSTLALLVCLEALELLGAEPQELVAVTMPGPGTGSRTRRSAEVLAQTAGVVLREINIDAAVDQHLRDLDHDPAVHDVTFENAQARERTQILFNLANKVGGIVVGTGDLSELALGWCTYNGDHMAGYNVNASVPKTLVAYLVRWYARHRASDALAEVLAEVLETPISPELVPGTDEEEVAQQTESLVGPYELHDFFLYHYLRHGASPAKIRWMAVQAFRGRHDAEVVEGWLNEFLRRFHSQQFKRTALPPGPKVGSVSLSPRGDWRMPDETRPPQY